MNKYLCTVCGTKTNERFCDQCQKLINEGYLACIGVDPEKSNIENGYLRPAAAYRTGSILWIKKEIARNLLGDEIEVMENELVFLDETYIGKITHGKNTDNTQGNRSNRESDPPTNG